MIFRIVNDKDGDDFFEVEADSVEEAALAALNNLGWFVTDPDSDSDE